MLSRTVSLRTSDMPLGLQSWATIVANRPLQDCVERCQPRGKGGMIARLTQEGGHMGLCISIAVWHGLPARGNPAVEKLAAREVERRNVASCRASAFGRRIRKRIF